MCNWGGGPYGNGAYDPEGVTKHSERTEPVPTPEPEPLFPHPGAYNGRRNDYQALSEYWAKRARHFEELVERITHG